MLTRAAHIVQQASKRCTKCGLTKTLDQYNKHAVGDEHGLAYWCRSCAADYQRAYKEAHPEKVKASQDKYLARVKAKKPPTKVRKLSPEDAAERRRERTRQYRRTKTKQLRARLVSVRNRLLDEQGGCCACCGSPDPKNSRGWHVDHDHKCCPQRAVDACGNCFRGVLCHNCNIAAGFIGDDPTKARALAAYLERTSNGRCL